MPQVPENLKPQLAILAKYHFWMLAVFAPLLLVPMLLLGRGALQAKITQQAGQIKGKISDIEGVQRVSPHPNDGWAKELDTDTKRVNAETFAEWQSFWDSQADLRTWPAELGADFIGAVSALPADGKLQRPLLVRYQNMVKELVKQLPGRMGADQAMEVVEDDEKKRPGLDGPRAEEPPPSDALVTWSADSQVEIYNSFVWEKPPTTEQVVLAQEELWVYGLLCDVIAGVNRGAPGPYAAPVSAVDEVAVGYIAAEDAPGGAGTSRLRSPSAGTGEQKGGSAAMGMGMGMSSPDMAGGGAAGGAASGGAGGGGGGAVRPPHPRFSSSKGSGGGSGMAGMKPGMMPGGMSGPGMPGVAGGGGADAAAEAPPQFRDWIYVDFDSKPLLAADLEKSPAAEMVHLMPFTLRVVVDQRKLDALLSALATSPVPIDVRQVRINPESASRSIGKDKGGSSRGATPNMMGMGMGSGAGMGPGMMPGGGGPGFGAEKSGGVGRPFDVRVELRGTIGIATPPNGKVVGIEPTQPTEPAAADAASVTNPAAVRRRDDDTTPQEDAA